MSTEVIDVTPETSESNEGAIQLHSQPSLSTFNRPVLSSDIEVVDTIQSAGIRPIAASHLDIVGTLMGGRPITSSHLRISEILPGNSPIFFSDIKMLDGDQGLLGRPVMASDPALLNAGLGFGNRPIASNEVDDVPALMGFID